MPGVGRIRISLAGGELEIEGDDAFVAQYRDNVLDMLARLKAQPDPKPVVAGPIGKGVVRTQADTSAREFGEAIHALPRGSSATDQMLVAGYYVAAKSADGTFATGEANKLLLEQGIKLSNPSQALKNGLAAKRTFKVGKRFKLSKTGEESIRNVIGLSGSD